MKKKRVVKRRRKKKVKTGGFSYNIYQVDEFTPTSVKLKVNNRESIPVRYTPLKGKFHSLINVLQEKGYQYMYVDEDNNFINLKPNDFITVYIYDANKLPDRILIYDEMKQVIIGYIPIDNYQEANISIFVDMFNTCQYIWKKMNQSKRQTEEVFKDEQ